MSTPDATADEPQENNDAFPANVARPPPFAFTGRRPLTQREKASQFDRLERERVETERKRKEASRQADARKRKAGLVPLAAWVPGESFDALMHLIRDLLRKREEAVDKMRSQAAAGSMQQVMRRISDTMTFEKADDGRLTMSYTPPVKKKGDVDQGGSADE